MLEINFLFPTVSKIKEVWIGFCDSNTPMTIKTTTKLTLIKVKKLWNFPEILKLKDNAKATNKITAIAKKVPKSPWKTDIYLAIAKAANETGDEKPITREIQLLR
jgi:hypothetical protein